MAFILPELPYAMDALEPAMSRETLEYHYGKHHQTYVTNLNNALAGSGFEEASLKDIILNAKGGLFNNAAQTFNHAFFWKCLTPGGGGEPQGALAEAINAKWGSYAAFREAFAKAAAAHFGSGWTWLVKNKDGSLEILSTANAGNPITEGKKPLLTLDVWEHAYYIDYRNARPKFIAAFFEKLVNWRFAEKRFEATACTCGGNMGCKA
ncbi:MAG: superoxide dismutase [Duodenibacillus sp.]|nr:superoxide dismutase [Duodenibacillus sp.]HBC69947.1 superoxide dismutase [Fe] [Sutterella sp.]